MNQFYSRFRVPFFCFLLFTFEFLISCNSNFTPKPKGYFKIDFSEKKYQQFQEKNYPYSFEYPLYASISKDSTFFGHETENPFWLNVNFENYDAKIHISYKQIGAENKLEKLLNDAFTLTNKHTIKATSKNDSLMVTEKGIHGIFFTVSGDVATQYQFFLTDSVKHFLRGALYIESTPNADSTKPVTNFLLQDMKHLINTFSWK